MISPKTAGNHIEHIYAKIGTSNRAGAGLFAVRHGFAAGGGLRIHHGIAVRWVRAVARGLLDQIS